MVTSRTVQIKKVLGQPFRSEKTLLRALTHPSFQEQPLDPSSPARFQRLEFLGDAVLNFFVVRQLYERFPKADEGLLSRMRSILVSRKLLARIARTIRLKSVLRLGTQERSRYSTAREKILADAFESLVAAVYFDRGLKATEQFLLRCFKPHFNQKKLFKFDPNPKSTLQEFIQKAHGQLPVYRTERRGDSFVAWASAKSKVKARGIGRTKQEAEAQAAALLLKKLKRKKVRRKR
jgi:ribonuclease III